MSCKEGRSGLLRSAAVFSAIGFFASFASGCTHSIDNAADKEESEIRLPDRGPAKPGAPCTFTPSNGVGCEAGPTVDIGASCDDAEIDTTSGKLGCAENVPSTLVEQGAGLPKIRVFYLQGLTINRDKRVKVVGDHALAIVSRGDVVIEGSLDASGPSGACGAGPGGWRGGKDAMPNGERGGGAGGGEGSVANGGASGGSFGGAGGGGGNGNDGNVGRGPGRAHGEATLVPLLGGSGGGGSSGCGGGGGGAVLVASSSSIEIASGGGINVGGGSGAYTRSAGGSGGGILLEAPNVEVSGTLAANGGGGGQGCSATLDAVPACGGRHVSGDGRGGAGSGGSEINGGNGTDIEDNFYASNAGGGGGGAGRIRINTSQEARLGTSAVISPAFETGLATQGLLRR